jgi:hypothetical protein
MVRGVSSPVLALESGFLSPEAACNVKPPLFFPCRRNANLSKAVAEPL